MALKHNTVLVFCEGTLTVKQAGNGEQEGWGTFSWDDEQVQVCPYEDRNGSRVEVEIAPSELRELRDFLNRIVPPL